MGWALAWGACYGCGRVFGFNPLRVPSIRCSATRVREPICPDCVARANPVRQANGLDPIRVLPDAYEPAHESELY